MQQVTQDILFQLSSLHQSDSLDLDANCALLLVDVQKYFFDPKSPLFIPDSSQIIRNLKKLEETFLSKGRGVYYTRHADKKGGPMDKWWKNIMPLKSEFSPLVLEAPPENIILKSSYDSFYETDLEKRLEGDNVSQLVVAGVTTHLCVESTVRSAFIRGYRPVIPVDAVGSKYESLHINSITSLAHGFAVISTTEDLCK